MPRLASRTACASLLLLLAASAGAQGVPADRALVAYVDSVAGAAVAQNRTAGVSVAVVRGGRTVLSKGYGFADLENDVRATDQTVYRIGSITKQFTSASIMRLAEQGKLSLDDTLQRFFPAYPVQGNRVAIHHLLNHTSGIRSYTSMGPKWARTMRLDVAPDTLVALFSAEPFDFAPGTQWRYDNSGYFLLGMIVEKASGKPYPQYVQDELFTPLGLTGTRYCDQRPLIKHRAQGYMPLPNGQLGNADLLSMTQPYAAGSLCSTVGDLVTWTRALSSGKVVSAASYARMTTPDTLNNGRRLNYGFGLNVGALQGHREISHNGGINGFISELHHYPNDSLIVVVLTNTEGPTAPALQRLIAKRALGIYPPPTVPLAPADAARYAGNYKLGQVPVRIYVENGQLRAQPQGQRVGRMRHLGNGRFVDEDDDNVVLQFPAEGNPTPSFVLEQNGNKTTVTREP